jgi:hypothetical protein
VSDRRSADRPGGDRLTLVTGIGSPWSRSAHRKAASPVTACSRPQRPWVSTHATTTNYPSTSPGANVNLDGLRWDRPDAAQEPGIETTCVLGEAFAGQ